MPLGLLGATARSGNGPTRPGQAGARGSGLVGCACTVATACGLAEDGGDWEAIRLERVMFVEIGQGIDLHGQDISTACVRACRNAIGHNSMPGIRSVLPDQDIDKMRVEVTLGVPSHQEQVDLGAVRKAFPYGQVEVRVVAGGLLASSGVLLPDQGDVSDDMVIVDAVVAVGY